MTLRNRALLLIATGSVLAWTAATPAASSASQRAGAVAVPLSSGLESETATIGYALESVVRQSHRVELVDLAGKAEGSLAEERRDAHERAKQLYARGVEAYQNFEFTAADHALEDAIAAFEKADLTEVFPELLEAYAMKAITAYYHGDVDGARGTIHRLLSLRPGYAFDGRMFPPEVREVAEAIRAEIEQESRNPLEVIAEGVNARVYINGVFRGISPIEVRDLPPAAHHVTLISLGHAMLQERQEARPGSLMRLSMSPAPEGGAVSSLLSTLERRLGQGEASEPGADIARWADLDEVLVAGVDRAGGGRLRVVMARVASDGHVLALGDHALALQDPAGLSELAVTVSGLYREDLPRGPNGEAVPRQLRISPVFSRTTAGYVVCGAGVAAGIGGVVMGLRARSDAASAREIPQRRQEEIEEMIGGAKRSALIADILYGAAFVGTVAGLYLAMPALRPEGAEPTGRGLRDDWFSVAPVPLADGAVLTVGGSF